MVSLSQQERIYTPHSYSYAIGGDIIARDNGLKGYTGDDPAKFDPNSDRMIEFRQSLAEIRAQGGSTREVAQKVHNEVHRIWGNYDKDLEDSYSYYDGRDGKVDQKIDISNMPHGKLVCQEFAILTSYGLNEVGIENHYTTGFIDDTSGMHAWVTLENGDILETTVDGGQDPFRQVRNPENTHKSIANGNGVAAYNEHGDLSVYSTGRRGNDDNTMKAIEATKRNEAGKPPPNPEAEKQQAEARAREEAQRQREEQQKQQEEAKAQEEQKQKDQQDQSNAKEAEKEGATTPPAPSPEAPTSPAQAKPEAEKQTQIEQGPLTAANMANALKALNDGKAGNDEKALETLTGQDQKSGGFLTTEASANLVEAAKARAENGFSEKELQEIRDMAKNSASNSYQDKGQTDIGSKPTEIAKDLASIEQAAQQSR